MEDVFANDNLYRLPEQAWYYLQLVGIKADWKGDMISCIIFFNLLASNFEMYLFRTLQHEVDGECDINNEESWFEIRAMAKALIILGNLKSWEKKIENSFIDIFPNYNPKLKR